jgi:hypothetical protein
MKTLCWAFVQILKNMYNKRHFIVLLCIHYQIHSFTDLESDVRAKFSGPLEFSQFGAHVKCRQTGSSPLLLTLPLVAELLQF